MSEYTFDEQIELGDMTETTVNLEPVKSIVYNYVFASILNDNRSEFYQASMVGLKPEMTFLVHDFEYEGEEYVRYEDVVYSVIRASKQGEYRELIVSTHESEA